MGLVAYIVRHFSPYLNSPFHQKTGPSGTRKTTGDYGEKVAAHHLLTQGAKILATNYKGPHGGEVDIIARLNGQLLFIEVKTRKKGSKLRGLAAINLKKRTLITRGANHWLHTLHTRSIPWRFDLIEIEVQEGHPPTIRHIQNIFSS